MTAIRIFSKRSNAIKAIKYLFYIASESPESRSSNISAWLFQAPTVYIIGLHVPFFKRMQRGALRPHPTHFLEKSVQFGSDIWAAQQKNVFLSDSRGVKAAWSRIFCNRAVVRWIYIIIRPYYSGSSGLYAAWGREEDHPVISPLLAPLSQSRTHNIISALSVINSDLWAMLCQCRQVGLDWLGVIILPIWFLQ